MSGTKHSPSFVVEHSYACSPTNRLCLFAVPLLCTNSKPISHRVGELIASLISSLDAERDSAEDSLTISVHQPENGNASHSFEKRTSRFSKLSNARRSAARFFQPTGSAARCSGEMVMLSLQAGSLLAFFTEQASPARSPSTFRITRNSSPDTRRLKVC